MEAHEIMITDVFKVNEKDTIREVIAIFVSQRISGVPIVNNVNEVVGYISDGDIMGYIGKHKDIIINSMFYVGYIKGDDEDFGQRVRSILNLNVMNIATKKVIKVQWNSKVENIATILAEKRIKKLPVERDGKLIGVISRGDVIRNSFKELL